MQIRCRCQLTHFADIGVVVVEDTTRVALDFHRAVRAVVDHVANEVDRSPEHWLRAHATHCDVETAIVEHAHVVH